MPDARLKVFLLGYLFLVYFGIVHGDKVFGLLVELFFQDIVIEKHFHIDQSFVDLLVVDFEIDTSILHITLHILQILVTPNVDANLLVQLTNISILSENYTKLFLKTCQLGHEYQI